ncbi:phosphonate metabolism protein/1,5-bisphosphokinase (PRPP-forming) PhnN [Afifella sp. IM 167]|uniref:phosphonate metabolism protein/1,5-bisphosphokinase (PRPP-forming) PhnN n=1 Tax=Afifella sp. IM 167 TaxID=2033586 RepID=UPI001CCE2429|nr:phosphonate metabolism protein/1,5-bisphosphokinase (PRPP-forming) PhnN [Afifella sp. IM 167]MBZ8132019.1 phosphonate metabolism protein/1,5-bisphosphokinase (PRPP-forming) PhnN [Afifella sp. IM 167]
MRAQGGESRGTLVLVVGPSGAGKDSLIGYCRERLADDPSVVFPRRVVTRAEGAFEDHASLAEEAFAREAEAGAFALHWRAHGLSYGIPASVAGELQGGCSVVVNVSRLAVEEARRRFSPLIVVLVSARREVLAERLRGRGRESEEEIARRLDRAELADLSGPDVYPLDNSGHLSVAGEALLALLKGCAASAGQGSLRPL